MVQNKARQLVVLRYNPCCTLQIFNAADLRIKLRRLQVRKAESAHTLKNLIERETLECKQLEYAKQQALVRGLETWRLIPKSLSRLIRASQLFAIEKQASSEFRTPPRTPR